MNNMEFKISSKNKWGLIISNGNKKNFIAIPPTDGDRVDFLSDNGYYHYDYKGLVYHGLLILISNGDIRLITIKNDTHTRLKRFISKLKK